jgi:hypothetical protein
VKNVAGLSTDALVNGPHEIRELEPTVSFFGSRTHMNEFRCVIESNTEYIMIYYSS